MEEKIRILLVEDVPTDADVAKDEIRKAGIKFVAERVDTKAAYIKALKEFKPDLILSDYSLPTFDGMSALWLAQELAPGIPFILMTGSVSEETAVAFMKAGATDYILKENIVRLGPAIKAAMQQRHIKEEKEEAETRLRESMMLYKTLFESANDAIFLLQKDRFIDCNPRTLSMFRCERAEILGKRPGEFSPMLQPDGSRSAKKASEKNGAALLGEPQFFEWRYQRLDGTQFDVEVSLIRIQLHGEFYIQAIVRDITDRKRAEEAIREAEKRYRAVVESAADIIYTINKDGRFTFANPAGLKSAGYALVELCQRNYLQLVLPEHRKRLKEHYQHQMLSKQQTTYVEFPFQTKDGGVKWYGQNASLVFEGKTVTGFHVIARDITERKRAEEAQSESEKKFRQLFDEAPVGYHQIDIQGCIVEVNRTELEMFGYTLQEMVGHPVWEFVSDGKSSREAVASKLAGSKPSDQSFERTFRRKDGTTLELLVKDRTLRNEAGEITGIRSTVQDITERKKAEEALLKLRKAVDASGEAMFLTDKDGIFTYVNPRFTTLYGYPADEVVGKVTPRILKSGGLGEEVYAGFWNTLLGKQEVRGELVNRRKDGSLVDIESSASPILDEASRIVGFLGIQRDITVRRQTERELRESEGRYRAVLNSATDAIVTSDRNGTIVGWNKGAERIFGYRYTEAVGLHLMHLMPQRHHAKHANMFRPSTGGTQVFDNAIEMEGLRKDGSEFPLELSLSEWDVEEGRFYTGIIRDITKRKLVEEALEQSENELQVILESTMDGILAVDNKGRVIKTNKRFGDLWRIPQALLDSGDNEKLLSFLLDQLISPEGFLSKVKLLYDSADEDIDTLYFKDGRILDQFSTPLLMSGSLSGRVWSFRDITEKSYGEEQLRKSELEYRNLFEGANDAIIIFEPVDETILEVNGKACAMYGYSRHELIGVSLKAITNHTAKGEEQIQELLLDGAYHNFETVHQRRDGMPIDILVSASMIEYRGQKAIQSINRDITEWKRTQMRLRQLSTVVEQSPASIVITDTNGKIEYVNPRFVQLTGYTLEEAIGKNPNLLKSGETPQKEYAGLWATITAGGEWRGEFHNKKKNGELYWEFAAVSPIKSESGAITHFLAVKEDITERKSLEQQLRQIQKLESIGTLAGGIAHDFNNILAIIMGHAGLLKRVGTNPDRLTKSIDAINTAASRGAGLVRQILTFARKTDVLFEPVLVNEIVSEMVLIMGETFARTITVETRLEPNLPCINADRTQIHQTLLNLCVNARDAMSNGGTFLLDTRRVRGSSLPEKFSSVAATDYVCISASDTGTGMDETTQQHLFEPFFTTKGKEEGTGLGLAVVYGIIQSHHGFIDVESALGKGTTFRMYFPILPHDTKGVKATEQRLEEGPGGNETLLIIEDEKLLRELLRSSLDAKGYTVLAATDGEQGLAVFLKHQQEIALVLTDLGLPKMDGDALFRKMIQLNPKVKVVLTSGYMDPEAKSELFAAGAKAFLQKPYAAIDALNCIREEIDRRNDDAVGNQEYKPGSRQRPESTVRT